MRRPTTLVTLAAAALLALSACAAPAAAPATSSGAASGKAEASVLTPTDEDTIESGGTRNSAEAGSADSTAEADNTEAYQAWATRTRVPLSKWIKDWENATCSASFAISGEDGSCQAQFVIGQYAGQVAAQKTASALTPTSVDYLGAEPPALSKTISVVRKDAAEVEKHRAAWEEDGCRDDPEKNGCLGTAILLVNSLETLETSLTSLE